MPEPPEPPEPSAPEFADDAAANDGPVESAPCSGDPQTGAYRDPMVVAVGSVRRATKGSAASGRADANSQFYW
ncbi:hypothetical protein B4N89_37060 [Embleya scabrispora]|uniref:Lasso RiPP family leader peptide-containing protein n=1 Tax=Embleya scabrispora TaxID=159449 RepID=A0A1T3NLV1_9ACTN|nr:hypothetical protein [Embleya scabrispora]OPC77873.1 hypothetical protein B4N89_37060 [Embleya scabrispora]